MAFRDRELEEWVLTGLGSEVYSSISPTTILDDAPQSLIQRIPSVNSMIELLSSLESDGLLTHGFLTYRLTWDGKLHYRKFLSPLSKIAKDEKSYTKIIEASEGDESVKKGFKKLLKSIKGKTPDEADNKFREFLYDLGKDGIWFTVRLIIDLATKS